MRYFSQIPQELVKCSECGAELELQPGDQFVRLIKKTEVYLSVLEDGEAVFAHPPCGWVVVRKGEE
jgi:hypothetical protein